MKRQKEIDPVAFGARIRELRLRLGLSQAALGRALGTKQGTVWSWENGDVKRPGDIVEIARALSTTADWLRYGEGPQHTQPFRPLDEIIRLYNELGEQRALLVIEFMRGLLRSSPRPKISKKNKKTAA